MTGNELLNTAIELLESGEYDCGVCAVCGAIAYCVEPDARGYPCLECDNDAVYGCEEIIVIHG